MSALPKRLFTPGEYLELELAAAYRSQFIAGEIFAMAGAEPWHDDIANNIRHILHTEFRGRPCKYYSSEVRVRVAAADMYTYPDVSALCGPPKFETADRPRSLLNPQVIVEVLSPSTEAFDRGEKFARYQRLDSLTDYVLVSADRIRVEHYARQPGDTWLLTVRTLPEQSVQLAGVNAMLRVAEVYERVTFPDELAVP